MEVNVEIIPIDFTQYWGRRVRASVSSRKRVTHTYYNIRAREANTPFHAFKTSLP